MCFNTNTSVVSQFVLLLLSTVAVVYAQDQGLTSASVAEGPCDPKIRDYAVKSDINPALTSRPVNYYVPIASEGCYRGYAEVLLGRPAQTQEELDSMKLRIRTLPPVFYTYGFNTNLNRHVRQTCLPPMDNLSGNQVLCRPIKIGDAPGSDTSGITTSLDTIVYTDNNSTLLIVRCLNDKVKDYKVLTINSPKVSPIVQQAIEDKIVELGFSKSLLRVKDNY